MVLNVRPAAARVVRVTVASAIVVIAVGGIPGARLRSIEPELRPVPSEVKERDGVIDVSVHDGPGGPPIDGARVRAFAIIDDRAYLADERETDRLGKARVEHLPRGELWIFAEAPRRARGSSHMILVDSHRDVAIDLLGEHAIRVVVHDELGLPIAAGEVEVVSRGDPLPVGALTDATGSADATRLSAGPWRVAVRARGYEDFTGAAHHDGEVVAITLRKLGAIAVHVVGPDDRDVARARIAVAGSMLWPARSAETDVLGDVRVGGLVAGTYAVRAEKNDRISPIELGIVLARGEEKRVVLRLTQGHFAKVRVTDGDAADSEPIRNARVTLVEGGLSPFPLEATTDSLGRARMGPIAPGSATLGVQAEGFMPRGGVLVSEIPAPETRVALVRSGALSGRVVDARGDPIDGATIEIAGTDVNGGPIFADPRRSIFQAAHFDAMLAGPTPLVPAGELGVLPGPVPPIPPIPPAGSGLVAGVGAQPLNSRGLFVDPWVTRIDGSFRAAPASPGRIRAIVHHPQYVEAQSDAVNLAPGGEAYVEVAMHQGGTLEGRVVDARDRPVAGARVYVSARIGSLERATRTASDGTFALAALPEAVTITVASGDDEIPDARLEVAIPEGGRKEVGINLGEPRGLLDVNVVDERGWPVAAAQVSASSLSTESALRATAFTDSHGDAQLKRARGLPLRIEVRAPARAPRVVTTDGAGETIRVELAAAESATGMVAASRGGDALAGADVTLYTETGARHTRTDAHGGFTLSDLAHGVARMRVRARGFAPVTRALTIPDSGGRRSYVISPIEMAAEGVVEGDVVDAQGVPVAGARVAPDHAPTWLLVGSSPEQVAVTDGKGRFTLGELPEGAVTLEAYAPDLGRAVAPGVRVVSERTTRDVHMIISPGAAEGPAADPAPTGGSVAITLGETGEPTEIVVVSVVEGSQAERAGVAPGDVLLAVDSSRVSTMEQARAKLSGPMADDVLLTARRRERVLTLRVGRDAVRR
jgi:PDZ domain/Carboxypeptidase regulatory-like domain